DPADLAGHGVEFGLGPAAHDDAGTGRGQRARDRRADAATASGDQRELSGEDSIHGLGLYRRPCVYARPPCRCCARPRGDPTPVARAIGMKDPPRAASCSAKETTMHKLAWMCGIGLVSACATAPSGSADPTTAVAISDSFSYRPMSFARITETGGTGGAFS